MSPRSRQHRVLLVEDHRLVREQLAALINAQPDLMVCGDTGDLDRATALLDEARPDVVLLDLRLGAGSGLAWLQGIRQRLAAPRVVVLTMYDDTDTAARCLQAGAAGFITKGEASATVVTALRTVLRGEPFVSPQLAPVVAGRLAREGAPGRAGARPRLSEQEQRVFELIGRGETTAGIAAALGIGVSTVETYRRRLRQKLDVRTGAELARAAYRHVEGLR